MNTLTYNLPLDSRTYVMTCNDEQLDLYIDLLFENGAYKVILNNSVEFTNKSAYDVWKNKK